MTDTLKIYADIKIQNSKKVSWSRMVYGPRPLPARPPGRTAHLKNRQIIRKRRRARASEPDPLRSRVDASALDNGTGNSGSKEPVRRQDTLRMVPPLALVVPRQSHPRPGGPAAAAATAVRPPQRMASNVGPLVAGRALPVHSTPTSGALACCPATGALPGPSMEPRLSPRPHGPRAPPSGTSRARTAREVLSFPDDDPPLWKALQLPAT